MLPCDTSGLEKRFLAPTLILTSLLAGTSYAPFAQATEALGPIVVTGTLTAKHLSDSPVRTEVIDKKELEKTHAKTLKDALENVAGLQLSEVHGKSGYQVSMQGLTSDQVLVLIDGLPITNSTGSTTDVSQYALAAIDHIEVVKGASSAQYGSSAMGGVVNVITKPIEPGIQINVQSQLGTYGSQNTSGRSRSIGQQHHLASIQGGNQTLRAQLTAEKIDDKGFSANPNQWAQQGDANDRQQYVAHLDWLPSDNGRLWIEANRYEEDDDSRFDLVLPPQAHVPQQNLETIKRSRFTGGGDWRWDNGAYVSLKGVTENYRSRSNKFSNFSATDSRRFEQDMRHVTGQVDLPYWRGQIWTLGADFHHEQLGQHIGDISELNVNNATRDSHELSTQNDIFIGANTELLLGARWQRDSNFGDHAVPKASLRYTLPLNTVGETNFRLSYGEGYRVPNLKERYFLFDQSALGYRVVGNPHLLPEKSNSWQFGMNYQWLDIFSAEANLFYNRVRDLIQADQENAEVINGISHFTYKNVGQAETKGAETVIKWRPVNTLAFTTAYTYTHAKDIGNDIDLTHRPKHITRLGIDWTLPANTTLTLRHRYQSSELIDSAEGARSPAWHRLDITVNQPIGMGFDAFIGVNNLLDKQREFTNDNDFSPITGRFIYAGFKYQWEKNKQKQAANVN